MKDQIEQFNWQRDMEDQPFPSTMQPFLGEVKEFCRKTHNDVLQNLYRCECTLLVRRRSVNQLMPSVCDCVGTADRDVHGISQV